MISDASRAHTFLSIRAEEHRYTVRTNTANPARRGAVARLLEIVREAGMGLNTFLCAVNYYDRAIEAIKKPLRSLESSLLTAVCVFVAAKHEEVEGCTVEDATSWAEQCDKSILLAESQLCVMLQMDLMFTSPIFFLDHLTTTLNEPSHVRSTALGLIEIFTFNDGASTHLPSQVATGALWIAREHHQAGEWSHLHIALGGYTHRQLQNVLFVWTAMTSDNLPNNQILEILRHIRIWTP